MKYIKCHTSNYNSISERAYGDVDYIVIHYTANRGDTAEDNGRYFHNNVTGTSAHFFVDQAGNTVKSVPLNHTAWSVGGRKYPGTKGGTFYSKCKNSNSVSIELCDNVTKDPSEKQIKAVKRCIKYIQKYCKNAKTIIRHYDVTGKKCPGRMLDNTKWNEFRSKLI